MYYEILREIKDLQSFMDYSSLDRKLRNPSEFELRACNIDGAL